MNEPSNVHIVSLVELAKALTDHLKKNRAIRVSELSVEANFDIVLRGITTSYYQKQLVQESAINFIAAEKAKVKIINKIHVKIKGEPLTLIS
jgi:predicted DNA-binding transcriptional regulator